MRRFYYILLIFIGILVSGLKPEVPCSIRLKISGIKDTSVYLASYYGDKILRVDSVRLNHDGIGVITRDKAQKEGIYLFYLNDKNYFEFLFL